MTHKTTDLPHKAGGLLEQDFQKNYRKPSNSGEKPEWRLRLAKKQPTCKGQSLGSY